MDWSREHSLLIERGIELTPGLTDAELETAEKRVGCKFPPDLRSFLKAALPLTAGMPDWRNPESTGIGEQLERPFEVLAFDLEHAPWWWPPPWGARPRDLQDAIRIGRERLALAPRLIPIWGHRYLPAVPEEAGNPVISMYQLIDSIYYGCDLRDYIARECDCSPGWKRIGSVRRIAFWSDVVETWWQRSK